MSDNPRDTQFAGFAKLIWEELVHANGYCYIDVNEDDDGIDPTNYRQIIARRAYDLVCHVMSSIVPNDLRESSNKKSIAEIVHKIPDMTE